MRIYIKDNKINYHKKGTSYDVPNDFFNNYNEPIEKYIVDIDDNWLVKLKLDISFTDRIKQINNDFDNKIESMLALYPKKEVEQFPRKLYEANKVINKTKSEYITACAKARNITELEMATKIIEKNNEFQWAYTMLEIEKDLKITELEKEPILSETTE